MSLTLYISAIRARYIKHLHTSNSFLTNISFLYWAKRSSIGPNEILLKLKLEQTTKNETQFSWTLQKPDRVSYSSSSTNYAMKRAIEIETASLLASIGDCTGVSLPTYINIHTSIYKSVYKPIGCRRHRVVCLILASIYNNWSEGEREREQGKNTIKLKQLFIMQTWPNKIHWHCLFMISIQLFFVFIFMLSFNRYWSKIIEMLQVTPK